MGIISPFDGTLSGCDGCCTGGGGGPCDCAACEYCACCGTEDIICTCAACFNPAGFPLGATAGDPEYDCGLDFDQNGNNDNFDLSWFEHVCAGCY